MSETLPHRPLWHPILWPTWFLLGSCRLLVLLPWTFQKWLGKTLARFVFLFMWERQTVIAVNLKLCFPELSDAERKKLASDHITALGIGIFETCMAWWSPKSRYPKYHIEGGENLENAMALAKGVLLLTAHFSTLELCGRFLAENYPLGGLYKDPENPVIAREMHRQRIDGMACAIPMEDLRGLLRALKVGHIIWYAPDQGKKTKLSAIIPFFGVPAITSTATSRIAAMSGAAVVPYFGTRLPDGSYLLRVLPALENFPTQEVDADTLRVNQLFEENIRLAPEQYFWVHRRFKRRGKGYPSAYPPRKKTKPEETRA